MSLMKLKKVIHQFLYHWLVMVPHSLHRFFRYKSKYYGVSYYPEKTSKSPLRIKLEQLKHICKYGRFEEYYYLYGLDVKDFRNSNDYLDYGVYMKRRDYLNSHPCGQDFSYVGILRDKFYFSLFMERMGFEVPKTFGLIFNKRLFLSAASCTVNIKNIVDSDADLIGKPLNGIGGIGIFSLRIKNGTIYYNDEKKTLDEFLSIVDNGYYFLQDRITVQHPEVEKLYPKSINTLRITTVRNLKTGKINVLGCMFLMGARNSHVSNWHYGGVIINVDENGYFDDYGYSLYEKRISQHPDTGVVFKSFKVPFFKEAVQKALTCHSMFYGVHSIGWDFAILPDKILFIEGNDDWGMAAHQMVDRGLQKFFLENFY